jgi:hypothetical protein
MLKAHKYWKLLGAFFAIASSTFVLVLMRTFVSCHHQQFCAVDGVIYISYP